MYGSAHASVAALLYPAHLLLREQQNIMTHWLTMAGQLAICGGLRPSFGISLPLLAFTVSLTLGCNLHSRL